jgi:hypothetical protein
MNLELLKHQLRSTSVRLTTHLLESLRSVSIQLRSVSTRLNNHLLELVRSVSRRIRSISARLHSDMLELIRSASTKRRVSQWTSSQGEYKKPLNIWTFVFYLVLSLGTGVLAFYVVLPMLGGMVSLVFKAADSSNIRLVSQEAVTGLIVVSTALGAFVLWFAEHPSRKDRRHTRLVKYFGKLFLFAALSLSLFLLLSPLLPDIRSKTDSYSIFLRYVTGISFITGSVSFAFADVFGLIYLWRL